MEKEKDVNKFTTMLIAKFMIRLVKAIIAVFLLSYIIGMSWYIFTEMEMHSGNQKDMDHFMKENKDLCNESSVEESFIKDFELYNKSVAQNTIIMVYYSITTISTVGFGDYYPVNNFERLIIIFIMIFGVSIYGLFLGIFQEMLQRFKMFEEDPEDLDELHKFFKVIEKFNLNHRMKQANI